MIEDHDAPSTSRGRKRGRKLKDEPKMTKIETFDEEGLIDESEESTSGIKLEVTSQEPSSTIKEGIYNQGNFYGWTKDWNPEWMYRLPGDVVLTAIRNGGSEGRGRAEIGKCLGIDTATKPGNRRVSGHIVAVQKEHEKHVGQFQKMEGKVRMIKYFWKKSAEPETFQKLFDDFRRLAKRECPFKMGQTIKFPDTGLSTLRISDVSLRRLNDILELLSVEEILTPIHKILKHIHNKEMAQGYQFQIDKKSMMKCLLALKKENLLNIFETLVTSDNVENKIQIVTRPYISSADSPEVAAEIQRTIDLYHAEGRVFPHGQLRYSTKKRAEAEKPKQTGKNEINSQLKQAQELLENGFSSGISLEQRYALFRLQHSKSIVAKTKSSDQMGSSGLDETATNEDSRIDGIDNTLDLIANGTEETSLEKENEPRENKEDEQIDEKAAHILLNCNGVLSDGVDDPSVPMRAIPKTLEHLVRKKDLYDPHIEYGFQSKYIRLCALHDIVWHFVYGNPRGRPSVFERYPPGRDPVSLPEVSLDQLPVYEETETPYRFMPSCDYEDLPAGWFMLQDFYCALPFSVFCLLSQIPKSAPKEDVLQLLTDPIARHTPLADLPISIRKPIFKDKRNLRHIEHTVFQLCAMGLGVLAPSPDPKRFTTAHTSVFYISKEGTLYDTSTSERGYAKVSLPLEQYNRYVYQFDDHNQVSLYWHHLRAISQSTPLNFRLEVVPGEINPNRHKSYSLGMFDRSTITWDGTPNEITSLEIQPLGPHDGCAGFDSALYLHLKRHWDLSPRPNNVVSWFVSWFRRNGDLAKSTIEQRVVKLQRDWNSVVRSLMPSDMELTRKKRVRASTDFVPSTLAMQSLHLEPKVRIPTTPKGVRHKKRPLDNVDIISQQNRLNLRCRFSAKERDMLILIRAVGFFLNPVYRFWLDPSAVRDIMHEYVPESGTKTVQSLMAAGVRELVRPNRLAYLQRIVCNLNTFKEMRALRFQLASAPLSSTEDKVKFFKNAFNMANRLLFMEAQPLPSTSVNDSVFEVFLASGKAIISSEQTRTQTPVPLRSQRPTSLSHIHHCTTTNVLLSVLIANANTDDQKPGGEYILEQLNPTDINSTLQVLRADGLLARPRVAVADQTMQYKNQATLSHYFRHFFGHRFHVDLIEQINQIRSYLDDINDNGGELADLEDYAGTVLIATDSFYNKNEIELDIDDALIQMFTEAANQNSTKQIRYLESTDLHLERVHVALTNPDDPGSLPTMKEITSLLDTSIPEDAIPARPLEEWLAEVYTTDEDDKEMRNVTMAIQATEVYGVNLSDLQTTTNLPFDKFVPIVEKLRDGFQIIEAGVDTKRYVWHTYADAWTVVVDGKRLCPRPWIQPTGSICLSTARWMLEALLMAVVNKPGIQKKDLQFRFEFALQPVALEQLIKVLTYCECLVENFEAYEAMQFSGPFEAVPSQTVVHTLEPTVQAIQRFASIFRDIQPIHLLTSGLQNYVTEDLEPNDTNSTGKKDVPLFTAPTPMEEI